MKRLVKLQINPQKVMKNEELSSLKGGYGGDWQYCETVVCPDHDDIPWGGMAESEADAMRKAEAYWEGLFQLPEHSCDCDSYEL